MNLNLKKLTIYIFLATFVVGLIVFAGSLIPSVDTTQSNFVTLEDIYQRTQHFDYVLPSTHDISYSSTTLEWSANQGTNTWNDAYLVCENLGTGWRLPTIDELHAGLINQFIDGGSNPSGFTPDTFYWSGTDYQGNTSQAWVNVGSNGYVNPSGNDNKTSSNAFRCVRAVVTVPTSGTMHTLEDIKNSMMSVMVPDVSDVRAGVHYGNARNDLVGTMTANCTPGTNATGTIYTSATTTDKLLPAGTPTSTMMTLEDLYQRMYNFDYSTTTPFSAHSLSTSSQPASSMHTLQDIWNAMLDITLPDEGDIRQGTIYGQASFPRVGTACDLVIGADYQGGKIAYILQPGDVGYSSTTVRGLIAAPLEQVNGAWGCNGVTTGAIRTVIGTGYQNTLDIISACPLENTAAKVARDYQGGGYTDWYLPSKDELDQIRLSGVGFSSGSDLAWTSTEQSSTQAFVERNNGQQGGTWKTYAPPYIHSIRNFGMSPLTSPSAPTSVSAIAGDAQATVTFTAPANDGGSAITGYTVTSVEDPTKTASGASSPLTVTTLTNGTAYTFTVTATNAIGTSATSAASNSVTPTAPTFSCGSSSVTGSGSDTLTYGTVLAADGRCWLDRNLGATRVATSFDDYQAYGSLYQWGRLSDGHQLINWTSSTTGSPVNGTTATLSTIDIPGHSLFILSTDSGKEYDWRNPSNDSLWQGVSGINNPCPSGFRLATQPEWATLISSSGITNSTTAYNSALKLPTPGERSNTDGTIMNTGTFGLYWTSSIGTMNFGYNSSVRVGYNSSATDYTNLQGRAYGFSVRCIKD